MQDFEHFFFIGYYIEFSSKYRIQMFSPEINSTQVLNLL